MGSPVELYQREMHSNLGFFATWLPADQIEIGDIGMLEAGRFRRTSSLGEMGIKFDPKSSNSSQNLQYTSTKGTKVTTDVSAAVTAVVKAQIAIDFSRQGAFVFHASGVRAQRLENRAEVGEKILKAYRNNKWRLEWLLVEALHEAEQATIIVSEDSSAGLVLVASAEAPISAVSLADPKISLSVASTHGKIVQVVGSKQLHPLYSCLLLKHPVLNSPSVEPARGSSTVGEQLPFARPSIDDLLEVVKLRRMPVRKCGNHAEVPRVCYLEMRVRNRRSTRLNFEKQTSHTGSAQGGSKKGWCQIGARLTK